MKTRILNFGFALLLMCIGLPAFSQHPADTFPIVSLCNLDLNRTATKLSPANLSTVSPAVTGYKWNSGDGTTLNWRPQGITSVNAGCKQFSVVSWYGRHINNSFPCNGFNADHRNRGSRVSFVDITDMNNIQYRHVLLVDENYNTFYDMHAGGLVIINDTLYAPDSRGATDAMYAFPLNNIKAVPSNHLSTFHDYGYILAKTASTTDSMPFNPSFVSYDWDDQEMVVGSFQNCPSNNCSTPGNNRMLWYTPGNVDRLTPFYNGLFGKMQGIGTATNLNNPNKKDVWVATSYGSTNTSRLYAFNYDFGINTVQNQSIDFANNYAYFSLPAGIEDIHIVPTSDTIWTLTEFSPNNPVCNAQSQNQRYVFGLLRNDIRPPGACNGDVNISQFNMADTGICTPTTLTYEPTTDYVAFADFDKSDDTWVEVNAITDTLVNSNRSVFMWLKQVTTVSSESQMLFSINTSSGGNVCNLQVGTNEKVGIYDGANSHYGTTSVTDGQWHHVGYTYNETTGETKIYVDGVQEATFNVNQTVSATDLMSLGQEFDSGLSKGNYLEGKMTEVTVWDEILDPVDISHLINATVQASHPKRANLMAYYPMNKVCGDDLTIVDDISGNGFNGKAFGTVKTDGIAIQSVSTLEQITNFNSIAHFNIDWQENGNSISTTNPLVLSANSYNTGLYSLVLTRSPFIITDDWNININYTSATDIQTACNTYTWIDGNIYTSNNNSATFTLSNTLGCDSIVTLDLTINAPSATTDVQTACNTYTWIDGNIYTSNNNSATFTLSNTLGCDSIVTLDLTINAPSATTDIQTACNTYTWIDGNTYTSNNNSATFTLSNTLGCDSIVTLDLDITIIDTMISLNGLVATVAQSGATYQWLDCNNGNSPIAGATNQSFTPSVSGNYAVSVSMNGCTEISSCYNITVVGIEQQLLTTSNISVFPNPTTGQVNINFDTDFQNVQIRAITITGQEVLKRHYENPQQVKIDLDIPSGIYFLEISSEQGYSTVKVIKN